MISLFARKKPGLDEEIRRLVPEASPEAVHAISVVRPFTMTGIERLWAMWQAMQYVATAPIDGDIVECGVWRGGNLLLAGLASEKFGLDRTIYGFDTYAGMSEPTDADVNNSGRAADEKFRASQKGDHNDWCYASIEDVRANVGGNTRHSSYRFIVGKCEETLRDPANLPERIALLRLDTDWYESTKAELEILYPRLAPGGILIIDDYGHWQGARQAVDEYFADTAVFMARIDYTARLIVKR